MITDDRIDSLYDADVVDRDGDSVGSVGQVYLDDNTGHPSWVTVKTGLFGTKETFVPLDQADLTDGRLQVPYEKSFIKDAPTMDADRHLSDEEQDELYAYYGVSGSTGRGGTGTVGSDVAGTGSAAGTGTVGAGMTGTGTTGTGGEEHPHTHHDATAGEHDSHADGDRMTLHEERVDVGTERVETGRVRLRKHVVTDEKTVTVPVQREEFEVVREPVSEGTRGDATLGEDEVEMAVHEERPVVDKDVVATEQVGIDRDVVTDEREVTTDVSREEVDVVREDGHDRTGGTDTDPTTRR